MLNDAHLVNKNNFLL